MSRENYHVGIHTYKKTFVVNEYGSKQFVYQKTAKMADKYQFVLGKNQPKNQPKTPQNRHIKQ
jgi:hypothetical protein